MHRSGFVTVILIQAPFELKKNANNDLRYCVRHTEKSVPLKPMDRKHVRSILGQ